jgi:hypothetical protein
MFRESRHELILQILSNGCFSFPLYLLRTFKGVIVEELERNLSTDAILPWDVDLEAITFWYGNLSLETSRGNTVSAH